MSGEEGNWLMLESLMNIWCQKGSMSRKWSELVVSEAPILWPPDAKSWLTGKDPDAGKGWRWEEKGTTEDEMVGWHHRLDGHEFEQALGIGEGQGGLVRCSPWGCKESDRTEHLNNNNDLISNWMNEWIPVLIFSLFTVRLDPRWV